jgi:lipid-A-disaccharide synthase
MTQQKVMILAGEASGDAHAAEFVEVLKKQGSEIRINGMGSRLMKEAGIDLFYDSSQIAVVGLVEVLRHWGEIKRAMNLVKTRLSSDKPDLLILVDYPEFNLKMARHAKSLGIKVLFYISPQVWAWRPKRIHKIGKLIDHMAVIFRFETEYYKKANIPVSFVGHPLVDKVKSSISRDKTRKSLGITSDQKLIGLFPGSRHSEINRLLPVLIETAKKIYEQDSSTKFIMPVADGLDFDAIQNSCRQSGAPIILSQSDLYNLIPACDCIASCSGTVTLEIALLKTPLCIIYKMSKLSYQIMSRLIRIPNIGLANIVAGKPIVKELLQDNADAENISIEVFKILNNIEYRKKMIDDLEKVRNNLGEGGGAEKMAELVKTCLAK